MSAIKIEPWMLIGAGIGGLLLLANTRKVASAIVSTAGDVATGAVEGIGQAVGVPITSASKCEADKKAGDLWQASFDCPALEFGNYFWDTITGKKSATPSAPKKSGNATAPGGGAYQAFPGSPYNMGVSLVDWAANSSNYVEAQEVKTDYAQPVAIAGIRG